MGSSVNGANLGWFIVFFPLNHGMLTLVGLFCQNGRSPGESACSAG